ncbi:hypothetical protein JYP52_16580 [Nitratireductor aquibiodomus]|uniref:glycosyltransferase n=1 Tax=Nitratireductor aquibiodomus TaxID=204799 RepID=UPI0019D3528A|nr:glycosyltransferase [Nitratireductor aquibiodomus]MBN7762758.1 hypothetical protein [Nitratireductor aquibiodomus]
MDDATVERNNAHLKHTEIDFASPGLTEEEAFAGLTSLAKAENEELLLHLAATIKNERCKSPRNSKLIARSAYNLGRHTEALSVLSRLAEEIQKSDYGVASLKARCQTALGDEAAALDTYAGLAETFPQRYEPLWEAANLLYRTGDIHGAYKLIGQCKDRAPSNPSVLRRFADLSLLTGHASEAKTSLLAVANDTDDISDWVNYARACFRSGDSDEAARVWASIVRMGESNFPVSNLPATLRADSSSPTHAVEADLTSPSSGYLDIPWVSERQRLRAEGGITVILTSYRRPEYLPFQLFAVENQTVKPDCVWHWSNYGGEGVTRPDIPGVPTAFCSANFRYHGRFALALLARTKYVAIFDDDTIPGPFWLENCLRHMANRNAIYGTIGVTSDIPGEYVPNTRVGWAGNNNNIATEVDLVGHSWVFERDVLKYFWFEEPLSWATGEDIHLSFAAQKHAGVPTIVPPHPQGKKFGWGSLLGAQLGADHEAASFRLRGNHNSLRSACMQQAADRGWVQRNAAALKPPSPLSSLNVAKKLRRLFTKDGS